MTLDRDIVTLTRRIQRESGDTIPFRQARLTAAHELGGLPVHTMTAEERIPLLGSTPRRARPPRHGDAYRVVLGTATLELCDGKG
ncbi:hypothetical protein ACFVX9_37330 [Kitasatospora sp. NPDC058243]|uniref:hypothetical protein n=1 Tax=Kitasatospora sp. NPDC058243 TaxID=3346397 RepID=UPI0036DD4284